MWWGDAVAKIQCSFLNYLRCPCLAQQADYKNKKAEQRICCITGTVNDCHLFWFCRRHREDWWTLLPTQNTPESRAGSCQTQYVAFSMCTTSWPARIHLHDFITFFSGLASFRLAAADGGSAPAMDHAERPFGPGRVSHWTPGTPEKINSHAVPRECLRIARKPPCLWKYLS